MNEIKLICTDIDGTLLNDNSLLNDYDKEMLKKAYNEKNIPTILTSGRFKIGLTGIQSELGFPTGYSCFNGSYVELDGKVLKDIRIELSHLEQIIPIIESNNSYPVIFDLYNSYMNDAGPCFDLQEEWMPNTTIATPLIPLLKEWEKTNYRPFKLLARDEDPQNLLRTKKLIDDANIEGINTFLSSPIFLEIVPTGISKASTVEIICNSLNINSENVMSFGDYHNDIELIAASGYGIAMDNAIDEVKAVAFAVTDSNNNSGLGKAIDKYVFQKNEI
jgi:Cof subfamily protein (haloacid dehalogenase superfamily)